MTVRAAVAFSSLVFLFGCDEAPKPGAPSSPTASSSGSASSTVVSSVSAAATPPPHHSAAPPASQPPTPNSDRPPSLNWSNSGLELTHGTSFRLVASSEGKPPSAEVSVYGPTEKPIRDVARSSDGEWLAFATKDGPLELWNVASRARAHSLKPPGSVGVYSTVFSGDGGRVALATNKDIYVWERETGKLIATLEAHHAHSVALDRTGKHLTATSTTDIWRFDVDTQKQLSTGSTSTGGTFPAYALPGGALAVSSDAGGHELAVYQTNPVRRTKVLVKVDKCEQHVSPVVSDNGKLLVVSGSGTFLRSFKLPGFEPFTSFSAPGNLGSTDLWMSADGRSVLVGVDEGKASLWATSPTRKQRDLTPAKHKTHGWAISPKGRWIAAVGEGQLTVWSAETGKEHSTTKLSNLR